MSSHDSDDDHDQEPVVIDLWGGLMGKIQDMGGNLQENLQALGENLGLVEKEEEEEEEVVPEVIKIGVGVIRKPLRSFETV
jgi:hypothetical protein